MSLRRLTIMLTIVITLAACGWPQGGYDAGQSNFNPAEGVIGPALSTADRKALIEYLKTL